MSVDTVIKPWHRADYILRGQYCPLPYLHAHLDILRRALDATLLLHVAVDHEVVMRSLNWASGAPFIPCDGLSESLRKANYRDEHRALNELLVSSVREHPTQTMTVINPHQANDLLTRLLQIELSPLNVTARVPQLSLPLTDWTGLTLNHTGGDGIAPRDGEVRSILLFHPGSMHVTAVERLLQDLGVMLKCTFEANTRRDAVVMNQVAQELSIHGTEQPDFATAASRALNLALRITGSNAGAVYIASAHDQVVFVRRALASGGTYEYPEHIPFDVNTTVGRAIVYHRAYQHIGMSGGMAPPLERAVKARLGTELVTPIAGPLADTLEPAIGAIVLYKRPDAQVFSAYERALIRNVSLRLALMHTTMANRDIAMAISALRRNSPGRYQSPQHSNKPTANMHGDWPKDIRLAVERFHGPLEQLAESTQSHSVSLRVALPDQHQPTHGLALTRVAAYPPARIDESFQIQKEGDPGPHWDVMRSGEEIYVRDTASDPRYPEIRPNTRSALCVPIRTEGILTGILNLESPLVDNYAAFLPIVVALCGAVGRTLADARASLEREVLDNAAHALAKRHEFIGDLMALRKGIEELSTEGSKDSLLERMEAMAALSQDLRTPQVHDAGSSSLWGTFVVCVRQTQLRFGLFDKPTDAAFFQPLDPAATQTIATVFRSLLRNISYHSDTAAYDSERRPVPRVRFLMTGLQGLNQAIIVLENKALGFLDPDFCKELYRYPVQGPGGQLRLGTYIAGLNARRIGAQLHACALDDLQTFRTTMIIPVGNLR